MIIFVDISGKADVKTIQAKGESFKMRNVCSSFLSISGVILDLFNVRENVPLLMGMTCFWLDPGRFFDTHYFPGNQEKFSKHVYDVGDAYNFDTDMPVIIVGFWLVFIFLAF